MLRRALILNPANPKGLGFRVFIGGMVEPLKAILAVSLKGKPCAILEIYSIRYL